MTRLRHRRVLLLLLAVLLLTGCSSEQTLVKKVNEPGELDAEETLKVVQLPWDNTQVVELAPDNQSAILWQEGGLVMLRDGQTAPADIPTDAVRMGASQRITWSPNSRYACFVAEDSCYVLDLEKKLTETMNAVLTACFNADQTTLYYTRTAEEGSVLYRRKVFSDSAEEAVLETPYTVHGAMFRTTKSQYLVMGDNKLLCLEQVNAGQPWSTRVVADYAPSGLTISDFSYSAQTGLCIVSGYTTEGLMAFSVVSPDGEDFMIDQVSCFSPVRENPVENVVASALSALRDEAAYPVRLNRVQLSPGGLYLLLWGTQVADGAPVIYVLNLDKGKLTHVVWEQGVPVLALAAVDWCAGKTLLLTDTAGQTQLYSLTGWDD